MEEFSRVGSSNLKKSFALSGSASRELQDGLTEPAAKIIWLPMRSLDFPFGTTCVIVNLRVFTI